MCGIAGIASKDEIDLTDLTLLYSALLHRGPDGHGFMASRTQGPMQLWLNKPLPRDVRGTIGFAHLRLAIIDLSDASLQPMLNETGSMAIVYNGEIYNYLELREELQRLGHSFLTAGDTEVLLKAYMTWGIDALKRLNGMWAFALFDQSSRRLVLARDRFGIKPLYFTIHHRQLYFASEIKALLAIPSLHPEPNEPVVARYLARGILDNDRETFFQGIYQLPAAHVAIVNLDSEITSVEMHRYWTLPTETFQGTQQDAVEQFRELFIDSVRIHSRSDVPVGTCLSGGLDSSSIVCAADYLRNRQAIPNYSHNTFGYVASQEAFSEKSYMEAVVEATAPRMHYVAVPHQQFIAFLPEIVRTQDEPFGSASIAAQWFVFQRARAEGIIVMLDGQGADEALGGYHHYFGAYALGLLRHLQLREYLSLRTQYEDHIGPFPLSRRELMASFLPGWAATLLRSAENHLLEYKSRDGMSLSAKLVMSKSLLALDTYNYEWDRQLTTLSLNDILAQDVYSRSLPALLRYEDRNSMAHSIESRVPFLDYRLIEFAFTLPGSLKINGLQTKHVLREAMKDMLPSAILRRKDKLGFKASPNLTLDFARQHSDELAKNDTPYEERWFRAETMKSMLTNHVVPEQEFALWRIINTKLWARQFWTASKTSAH